MEGTRKRETEQDDLRRSKFGKIEDEKEDGEPTDMVIVPANRIVVTIGEYTFYVGDDGAKRALARIVFQFGTKLLWSALPKDVHHLILAHLRKENHREGGKNYFTLPLVCKSWSRHFDLLLKEMPGRLYENFLRRYPDYTIRTLFALQMRWLETGMVSSIGVHFRASAERDIRFNTIPSGNPVFTITKQGDEDKYKVWFSREARDLKNIGFYFANRLQEDGECDIEGETLYKLLFACTYKVPQKDILRLQVSIGKAEKLPTDHLDTLLHLVKATRIHVEEGQQFALSIAETNVAIFVERYHELLMDTKNPEFRDKLYQELSRSKKRGAFSLWGGMTV
jgi:hypothetical protein